MMFHNYLVLFIFGLKSFFPFHIFVNYFLVSYFLFFFSTPVYDQQYFVLLRKLHTVFCFSYVVISSSEIMLLGQFDYRQTLSNS